MDSKEITFEDWLEGRGFNKSNNKENALDLSSAYEMNEISEEDFNKISKSQETAYDILLNRHVESEKKLIDQALIKAPEPISYLEEEAKQMENKIEPFKKAIFSGRKSQYLIDGLMYRKITSEDKLWILFENETDGKNKRTDKLFQAWVDYTVLQWVKKKLGDTTGKVQVGRPEDFPSSMTLNWYNELKVLEDFQHKNRKPHKTKIKKEIIERHGKLREDNNKPAMDTINDHFRKLGLTES